MDKPLVSVVITSFNRLEELKESVLRTKRDTTYLNVQDTHADVNDSVKGFNYKPTAKVINGIESFVKWYREFYKIN